MLVLVLWLAFVTLGAHASSGSIESVSGQVTITVAAPEDEGQSDVVFNMGTKTASVMELLARVSTLEAETAKFLDIAAIKAAAIVEPISIRLSAAEVKLEETVRKQGDISAQLTAETTLARQNEEALTSSYNALLIQLNELANSHTELGDNHSNTFDLMSVLVEGLEAEVKRAKGAEQTERDRALAAEEKLDGAIKATNISLTAEIAKSISNLRANPPSLVPVGKYVGELAIQSAGGCNGNFVRVWVNGVLVPNWAQGRGINCVFFDNTLTVLSTKTYDTHASLAQAARMATDVFNAPHGTPVLCGVIDEATQSLGSTDFFADG